MDVSIVATTLKKIQDRRSRTESDVPLMHAHIEKQARDHLGFRVTERNGGMHAVYLRARSSGCVILS